MSKWGTFVDHDGDRYHVAPCTKYGIMLPPHRLSTQCVCKPMRDDQNPQLIIHNDPKRGGIDG